jgi:2-dehydropantoate 2-reductase
MTFSLTVDGACETPLTLDWGALDTLAHGADLVADTAALSPKVRGQGVRLGAVIDLAHPRAEATHVMVHDDGEYRACLTLDEARRAAVLAHRLDGAPLPEESGGPARLLVPTSKNACMSVKRVVRLELLTQAAPDTVPRPTTPLRTG